MMRFHSAPPRRQRGQATLSVVLIYAIFAALWILFSDMAVEALFTDPAMIVHASMIKGWLFVAVTTGLLYLLIKRQIVHLDNARRKEIASLREQQENETRLREIVESAAEGFWMIDAERRTLAVNEAMCQLLGYARAEMIGRHPTEFADAENCAIFRDQMAKIGATTHRRYEITLLRKNGSPIPLYFQATTHFDAPGKALYSFAFVTDLTARKAAEAELHARNAELERFNRAMIGRELDIIEVKKHVNALARELGREPPYPLAFEQEEKV